MPIADKNTHTHDSASRYNLSPASSNHSMPFANQIGHTHFKAERTSSDFCMQCRNSTEMGAISSHNSLYKPEQSHPLTAHLGTICLLRRQITRCPLQTRTATPIKLLQGHRVISAWNAEIVPRWVLYRATIPCTNQNSHTH
jgi:hypothetical protein